MARYIDADRLCENLKSMASVQPSLKQSTILGVVYLIENTHTADVAPNSEVARVIFEDIEKVLIFTEDKKRVAELKKKYAEGEE